MMNTMASQITSLTIVYSTVYSRRRRKKTSKLRFTGFCVGNSPVIPRTKGQLRWKCFHLMTSSCRMTSWYIETLSLSLAPLCCESPVARVRRTPQKGPEMWSFYSLFDVSLNKLMKQQPSCRWFETFTWRHCNLHSVTEHQGSTLCEFLKLIHYSDVIMGAMASQIIRPAIVYSTVYPGADQRKH